MYRTFNFRFTRAPFQFFHNVEIGSITNRYDKFVVYSNWTKLEIKIALGKS